MTETPQFILFGAPAVLPVDKVVDPATVIDGDPAQKSWLYADIAQTGARSGQWDCQAGRFTVTMDGIMEFCSIIEGGAEITNLEDGTTRTVTAGDAFVMQPGLRTQWHVPTYIKKHFVITDLR